MSTGVLSSATRNDTGRISVDPIAQQRLVHTVTAVSTTTNYTTLAELAERSGVSRAMLSKIERDEASPTAELLVRIAAAFGMTLSSLIALAEMSTGGQVLRAEEQRRWTDPGGYRLPTRCRNAAPRR